VPGQCSKVISSATLESFQFVQGARPVGTQQSRQTTIGKHLAPRLAARAIVGLLVGVANAQDLVSTARTGFAITAMDRHVFAEGRHLFREFGLRFGAKPIRPRLQCSLCRLKQPLPLFGIQFVRQGDGRELGRVQDFIGIGIANPAHQPGVGERSF
jgi:hypothetical protein